MAYSLNPSSDNCYAGTTCLINKLDIRDEKRLSEIDTDELMIATIQASLGVMDFLIEFFKNAITVPKKEKTNE